MKWNRRLLAGSTLFLAAGFTARADLARWIQDIASPDRLQSILFKSATRRPPRETLPELTKLIAAAPNDTGLYAARAREDELQLDFAAAEEDWKKAGDPLALADFYHRRIKPREEIAALDSVGKAPSLPRERLIPANQQQSWKAFERIQTVIADQALPADLSIAEYRTWLARYSTEPLIYQTFFDVTVARKQFPEAEKIIADYRRAFPNDNVFPVVSTAALAAKRGSAADALRVYDQSFQPLWPPALIKSYFDLLKETHNLRRFLEQARTQISARPGDIGPAARLFFYQQQHSNAPGALRALYEYRQRKDTRKSSWTADELWTLGQLFQSVNSNDDAARAYYTLYNAGGNQQERALAAIAGLLMLAPEQPVRFGSGDLSLYKDIATMDQGPGFLNGILSLLFNSTGPQFQFDTENQASVAYFHRAKASELISEFDRRFPKSDQRATLRASLINAYVTYGDDAGVLRAGRDFLTAFPKADQRTQVALNMADAYARQEKTKEEFALYDALLKELAAGVENVPLGEAATATQPAASRESQEQQERPNQPGRPKPLPPGIRSPEYARVLDRYLARLVELKRVNDGLALFRREMDRNPNDPGLYEHLAGYLEQNKLDRQIEQVYRKAMGQFQNPTWSHKLARWYLKRKQVAQFDMLTRDVVKVFSGTQLEAYLTEVGSQAPGAILYRQVNLYAHERFPYDLMFVRNLLSAYATRGTADPVAREALLRSYWSYAPDLRDSYFELLSRTGRLKTEMAADPARSRFVAEAEAWQAHFERAAPLFRAVAADYPGDIEQQTRTASLYRSLATYDVPSNLKNTDIAASLQENASKANPRDPGLLATVGDIYADREQFSKAKPFWDRIATIDPGKSDGYIDAATVYWDYYHFPDAFRLINDGRRKLENPQLFSYEAGAIYENQRDYGKAIQEYAKGALASVPDDQSKSRLTVLSRRTAQRPLIDTLTSRAASGPNAPLSAISLRFDILVAQNRPDDLSAFLLSTATATTSPEVLQFVDENGGLRGLDRVQEQAKLRKIALSTDPIEKLQGQLSLVHFYENSKNPAAAKRLLADLYKSNPTVLGVIRATVDFDWRTKDLKGAVDVLAEAASKAQPTYRDPFALEAARKATEAGDYSRAREFLEALLGRQPFDSRYVAAMADTYARQNDDQGLRTFYTARLKLLDQTQLSAPEKIEKMATLRRGLIPVLTRLKDYTGATDQYIEVLNRYAEDAGLAQEVATYALNHGRSQQLLTYYQNTQKQSPKDYRWALVEARIDVQLENFPSAVAAYQRASLIRPDRIEFYTERASLEERLLRFDEAVDTYSKLYELNYHNSQWMEHVAEVRARQGQADAAVKALDKALIEGRPPKVESFFAVARKLESWNLVSQAKPYAEKGVQLAGADLVTTYASGAQTYARVMTRLRQYDTAYQRLDAVKKDKLDEGILRTIGATVAEYFTPEEKVAFASFASPRLKPLLAAVQAAGLMDLYAKESDSMEQRRLRFAELAARQESYWKSLSPDAPDRDSFIKSAVNNYRLAGDSHNEARVLTDLFQRGGLDGNLVERVIALLARTPEWKTIAASPKSRDDIRNGIANYMMRSSTPKSTFEAITARGQGLPPVWTRAYTALAGLYFSDASAPVNRAFVEALGAVPIGQRLGKTSSDKEQLIGQHWFYFGSRYGEYLDVTKLGDAEEYLPSSVEARPGSSDAYFGLGEYYREAGRTDRSREQYQYALELDAGRADVHDRIALLLAHQSKRDEAIAEFRAALDALARQQDERQIPQSFWDVLRTTLDHLAQTKLSDALHADVDRVLRTYVRRNGPYRANEFLPAIGVPGMLDLSHAAPDQVQFLQAMVGAEWIAETQRAPVYQALLDAARNKPDQESDLRRYQIDFANYLVGQKRAQEAQVILRDIPEAARTQRLAQIIPLELRIAAENGSVPALLNRFGADSEVTAKLEFLRNGAVDLQSAGDQKSASLVLDFVYTRQIEAPQLDGPTFLGLAAIRLDHGDVPAALALLRRMTMVVGEPFENLLDAGKLLLRTGHAKEAIQFIDSRVKAVPWDAEARVLLAKAQGTGDALRVVIQSNDLPYLWRVDAARGLRDAKAGPATGTSTELGLLSSATIPPAAAEKPYFYFARVDAAAATKDLPIKIRLLLGAIAIDPNPDQPKFDLMRAAIAAKRWQLAVSTSQFLAPNGVGLLDKPLVRALGQAYEALGDLNLAQIQYTSAGAETEAKRVQALTELQNRNEGRRPIVTNEVDQPHPVRPKLVSLRGGAN